MKKLPLILLLVLVNSCGWLRAQTQETPPDSGAENIVDRAHAQDWISDIDTGWLTHAGDDSAWASPGFDDSWMGECAPRRPWGCTTRMALVSAPHQAA